MEHQPYSPEFWLFPKILSALKGRRFKDTEKERKNVTMIVKAIPQQEFQKCFQQWQAASLGKMHSCSKGGFQR
jgi:hypothetical protein